MVMMDFQEDIEKMLPEMTDLRRHIHTNPELAFDEKGTAQLIADHLKSYGYHVQLGIGGTGVSTVLDSGKPGKTVLLRADIDALPILEETNLPYQSKNKGKMHACGHDGHTVSLLTAARFLKANTSLFKGKIKLIFQPAEEIGGGAAAMIKDGVLENPKVDAAFAYHNWPGVEAGIIATRNDCLLAGLDSFTITINGKGGHAATPEACIDPIYIGSCIIESLQSIVSRGTSPLESVVISVTEFHGGSAINVIPNSAVLSGSMRTTSRDVQTFAKMRLKQIAEGIAATFGATVDVAFTGNFPITINTLVEVDLVLTTARELFGDKQVMVVPKPLMYAEDFSYFLEKVPGCYLLIGNGIDSAPPHTSHYNFQDKIIPIAARTLSQIAMNYLNNTK